LISNFRRVLIVVCFLLGNSPASEFYIYKIQTPGNDPEGNIQNGHLFAIQLSISGN